MEDAPGGLEGADLRDGMTCSAFLSDSKKEAYAVLCMMREYESLAEFEIDSSSSITENYPIIQI